MGWSLVKELRARCPLSPNAVTESLHTATTEPMQAATRAWGPHKEAHAPSTDWLSICSSVHSPSRYQGPTLCQPQGQRERPSERVCWCQLLVLAPLEVSPSVWEGKRRRKSSEKSRSSSELPQAGPTPGAHWGHLERIQHHWFRFKSPALAMPLASLPPGALLRTSAHP